eukprot:TRINITY_DN8180_c0_g1_i2.p1 TRINITY_DN8180_c0_g1~~TRINITY_DN8180_c0_g1_i2.p1  ORF type:complete len:589 (-),score=85.16 TRINITY_DN8180_c0_g1_i2:22-1788(-)
MGVRAKELLCTRFRVRICIRARAHVVCHLRDQLLNAFRFKVFNMSNITQYSAGVKGVCAEDRRRLKDSVGGIVMVAILSFLGFLAILSTGYEVFREFYPQKAPEKKLEDGSPKLPSRRALPSRREQWLRSFGLIGNVTSLTLEDEANFFSWFNCWRFISMCWIMMAHFFLDHVDAAIPSNIYWIAKTWFRRFLSNIFLSADPTMETFFFMGGMLMAWSLYKKLKQGRMDAKEWMLHFLHRYLRLTPIYIIVLFATHYLVPLMARGPYAMWMSKDYDYCAKYWWTNVLYVNNFIPKEASLECMGQCWFLAVDMQLYIFIGTPLTVLLFWKPLVGVAIAIATVLASAGASFGLAWAEDMPVCKANPNWLTYYNDNHVKPWMRMGVYAIGVLLGVLIVESEKNKQKIKDFFKTWMRFILLSLSVGTILTIIFSTYPLYHSGIVDCWTKWSSFQNSLYWGATRPAWGISLAIMTYLFWLDRSSLLCRFQSAYVWAVPSRLVYCVYLFHPEFIFLLVFSAATPYIYTDLEFTIDWTGLILTSFFLCGLLFLFGEKPLCNVETVIMSYLPSFKLFKEKPTLSRKDHEKSPLINQ